MPRVNDACFKSRFNNTKQIDNEKKIKDFLYEEGPQQAQAIFDYMGYQSDLTKKILTGLIHSGEVLKFRISNAQYYRVADEYDPK